MGAVFTKITNFVLQVSVSDGQLCSSADVNVDVTGLIPSISVVFLLFYFLYLFIFLIYLLILLSLTLFKRAIPMLRFSVVRAPQ